MIDAIDPRQGSAGTTSPRTLRVLDPSTLGRPVHLTDRFTGEVREEVAEYFRIHLNRRYRAAFEVGAAQLTHSALSIPQRWLTYRTGTGCIGFAMTREVVLRILRHRYGMPDSEALEPETASEDRLATLLGARFAGMVARRIESLHPDSEPPPDPGLIENPGKFPSSGCWTLRVDVAEPARNASGSLWFLLDGTWVARLLQGLAPQRERTRPQRNAVVASSQPLPARLQLTLTARMLEKELPLGTILDLRVGAVIPVNLARTDVLVDGSRLFTASIAEHKGKLCLTTFEDME